LRACITIFLLSSFVFIGARRSASVVSTIRESFGCCCSSAVDGSSLSVGEEDDETTTVGERLRYAEQSNVDERLMRMRQIAYEDGVTGSYILRGERRLRARRCL
jgi:hypothetical protein